MKKKISKTIQNKIISKPNILALIDYLYPIFDDLNSEHKQFVVSFFTTDYERYEIENSNLGKSADLLDIKKIEKISIDLIDYRNDKTISIELSQGGNKWYNSIIIKSSNEEWVNHQNSKIDEMINSWKPQNNLFSRYKSLLYHLLSINIGWFILNLIKKVQDISGFQSSEELVTENLFEHLISKMLDIAPFSRFLLIIIFSWITGMIFIVFIWDRIVKYFESLWPTIEFDFGPEHLRKAKKNRKAIGLLISLIVIPILLHLILN